MSQTKMTPELIALVATRFKALAEPARLQILNCLRGSEMTVSELVEATGFGRRTSPSTCNFFTQPTSWSGGRKVCSCIMGSQISGLRLCDIMCGRLEQELASRRKALAGQ